MYESLLSLRPILFGYASEETDFDEAQLEKLLGVNDGVNRAIQLFRVLIRIFYCNSIFSDKLQEMFADESTGKKEAVNHNNCREAEQCSSAKDALRSVCSACLFIF